MSDTPRSDAMHQAINGGGCHTDDLFSAIEFARELERELNFARQCLAANAMIEAQFVDGTPEAAVGEICRLRAENESLRRAYVRPDDLREQLETAKADNAKLREVRAAVLAYEKITDTQYALGRTADEGEVYNMEFLRLLRALREIMVP